MKEQYAWPGGYLIEHITEDGCSFCADCLNDEGNADEETVPYIHVAGSKGYTCDYCGKEKV